MPEIELSSAFKAVSDRLLSEFYRYRKELGAVLNSFEKTYLGELYALFCVSNFHLISGTTVIRRGKAIRIPAQIGVSVWTQWNRERVTRTNNVSEGTNHADSFMMTADNPTLWTWINWMVKVRLFD